MAQRSRQVWVVIAAVVVLLAGGNPAAALTAPSVGAVRRAPANAFRPDEQVSSVAWASQGADRVLVWGTYDEGLNFDRFTGTSGPSGRPVTVAELEDPDGISRFWGDTATALGNGFVLASVFTEDTGAHGLDDIYRTIVLLDPSGQVVPLTGSAAGSLGICPDFQVADNAVTWTGSAFLLARACSSGTRIFRVTTAGAVSGRATLPAANTIDLASNGSASLLAYSNDAGGNEDVHGQRLDAGGAAAGPEFDIATGSNNQTDPTVAASGNAYLVGWRTPAHGGDISARTVSAGGALGATRPLVAAAGFQGNLDIVAGAAGTYFTAWSDERGGDPNDDDVFGTKVSAAGVPTITNGRLLVAGTNDFDPVVTLATGPNGTAFLGWRQDTRRASARQLDAAGNPTGATSRIGRAPVAQTCVDVSAGNGQFLVTWQESRVQDNANIYAQRYTQAGTRTGPVITVSSASGNQFCPTAAWNGSNWLVVWTDGRSGPANIFGAQVSGTGAVAPTNGFAISTAAGVQQTPAVTANGTSYVVAWNDGRNGNQDIYAARVTAGRTVLDPSGLAVTTAAGIQRQPTVASVAGSTLIAWTSNDVQRRILRSNGTFLGGVVSVGPAYFGTFNEPARAAASGNRLAVMFEEGVVDAEGRHPVSLVELRPDTGAVTRRTTLRSIFDDDIYLGGDVSHDGSRFMFGIGLALIGEPGSGHVVIGSTAGGAVAGGDGPSSLFNVVRIASLPNGRSLVVSDSGFATTITAAPVDDDGS